MAAVMLEAAVLQKDLENLRQVSKGPVMGRGGKVYHPQHLEEPESSDDELDPIRRDLKTIAHVLGGKVSVEAHNRAIAVINKMAEKYQALEKSVADLQREVANLENHQC
ncbi:hypothetical protein HJFPF1_01274 [Paramyrothecium foliicola]|nr:hypothetical protein HJFPF1_01274 [Paramyrothecium foliicola]